LIKTEIIEETKSAPLPVSKFCGKKRRREEEVEDTTLKFDVKPNYDPLYFLKTEFVVVDAGKGCKVYDIKKDLSNLSETAPTEHISHIYSYNKVMGESCLRGISRTLNRTNFKILAWYVNEKTTYDVGVWNVKLLLKKPMQSTGGQNFSVYVYFKTNENESEPSDSEEPEEKKSKRTPK